MPLLLVREDKMLVNLKVNLKIENNHKKVEPSKELVRKLYWDHNKTLQEIADIHGYKGSASIRNRMNDWGVPTRSNQDAQLLKAGSVSLPNDEIIIDLYLNKLLSTVDIGEIYNCPPNRINKILKRCKIEIRSLSESIKLSTKKRERNSLIKWGTRLPQQHPDVIKKWETTNMERRGVKCVLEDPEIMEKSKKTCKKKYGTEYSLQVEEVRIKGKKTMKEKYGAEYAMQVQEFIEKRKQTNLEKHGVENAMESKEVQEKGKKTNMEKYGVENVFQVEEFKDKIKNYNLENHGCEHVKQKHIKNYKIWNNEKLFQEWIVETYNKLGRKLTTGDLNNYFNLSIVTLSDRLKKLPEEYNKYYKIKTSYFETLVEDWIKKNTIAIYERNKYYDFLRNSNGNMMQLDFFFPELKIAVEVNDNWSHNPEFRVEQLKMDLDEAQNYEQIKSDLCEANGIRLIHLWEDDFDNIDSILGDLVGK
jgi:hypothetical protein